MKTIGHLILTLAVLSVSSCSRNSYENEFSVIGETSGVMQVEIVEEDALADKMETVRFFVFTNLSGNPQLELNERFDIPDPSGEGEVSKLKITLEVSRKTDGVNDKLVIALINEPSGIKEELDAIKNYDQLRNMQLSFADFLTVTHRELQNNKTMPMTGIVRTHQVYPTPQEAENSTVRMSVQRVVARVDIYAKRTRPEYKPRNRNRSNTG
ncbi:MAG: hypothetical protein LIP01_12895 [Tannerellaceae bacterium]|nr:hypothetical protein [Tannerellaceae bacterium]